MSTIPFRSGLKPVKWDRRDLDLFKTKKFGAVTAFPEAYSTEVGMWNPSQNDGCDLFTPAVPPLFYGCTSYTGSDILTDEDKQLFNPMDIENITHANANGGTDIRTALRAVTRLHPNHPQYFTIVPDLDKGGSLDWFDAIRVALIVGKTENRAVSVGTPWFSTFMNPANGVISMPYSYNLKLIPWHNWAIKGWKTINGQAYLIGKPWIGASYGDKGFCYISRADFNLLMSISGCAAYTLDKLMPGEVPQRVDSSVKQLLLSFFWQLFGVK